MSSASRSSCSICISRVVAGTVNSIVTWFGGPAVTMPSNVSTSSAAAVRATSSAHAEAERHRPRTSVDLEDGEEGLLRNLHAADHLHALLALFLLLEELALAAD